MATLCACGCGQPTSGKINNNTGRPAGFISGHNRRGLSHSQETRAKIAAANRGKPISPSARAAISGVRNPHWKGDEAGYQAVHMWRRLHRPKTGTCSDCQVEKRTEWHTISGDYRRDDNPGIRYPDPIVSNDVQHRLVRFI